VVGTDGNGTFRTAQTFAVGASPGLLTVADINGDGKQDIVALAFEGDERVVSVLLGNGNGTFGDPEEFPIAGAKNFNLVVADVTGDGQPDIVVPSFYGTLSLLVNGADGITVVRDTTTSGLTSSVNQPVYGQSVTFTADITANAPGSGTPTGTVTFLDGSSTLGTGVLSGGVALLTTSGLAVGNQAITISYGGDANFIGSTSSTLTQTVGQDSTSTAVTTSVNPASSGQNVTFTAVVSAGSPGSGTPTGTVIFEDGGVSIGSGSLSGGVATFSTSGLSVGTHAITVAYAGDSNFSSSLSAALTQTVA
jgi:hypothetical protein